LIDVNDHASTISDGAEQRLPAATSVERRRNRRRLEMLRAFALGAGFPILLILVWDRTVAITGTRLIPSPYQVAVMMYDFTFGGVYDDAFSGTILTHVWKSVQRVYGGFFLAALIGIPLGMMIGRIKVLRQMLDPTISLLRPIPVTAWLPLSMIFFGLGPNAGTLDRSAPVRGGIDARMLGNRNVPADRAARLPAGDIQRTADRPRICLDIDRGRRNDRRTHRPRLGGDGWPHPFAH
jgi:hypothetical protein